MNHLNLSQRSLRDPRALSTPYPSYILAFTLFVLLSLGWKGAHGQDGTMYDPILIPISSCGNTSFSDYQNTGSSGNDYGHPSPDVWYTFTLQEAADVEITLCGSGFDTYLYLLNENMQVVLSDDDGGCDGGTSAIYEYVQAGTYYLVVDGAGSYNAGDMFLSFEIYSNDTPSEGSDMYNPIYVGEFSGSGSYSNTVSNVDPCLGNDYGELSNDIYYTFNIYDTSEVTLSNCGSNFDTYLYLLDASGNLIDYNDDSSIGPCPGRESYLQTTLEAGTYYVVSEGYYDNTGSIVTNISVAPAGSPLPVISYTGLPEFTAGVPVSITPVNTGGAVSSGGQITSTLAGNGSAGSANGTGIDARFRSPLGTATDAAGNVYVADAGNHSIRKITPSGVTTTFAGSGTAGYADGTGTSAFFRSPSYLAVDASGNVFVSDQQNHSIRKITPAGVTTTFAGSGTAGFANGTGTAASFNYPGGLAFDGSGNLYVSDANRIRKITSLGVVTTFAGTGTTGATNGAALSSTFNNPAGLCFDGAGNLYIADCYNHRIRKITPAGVVSTFAGSGTMGSANGTGTAASFIYPTGIVVASDGNLYVADTYNNMIRKITSLGAVSTFAGNIKVGTVDGTGDAVRFNSPYGLSIDNQDNIYITQNTVHQIRKTVALKGYTISPALPEGLAFNNSDGTISGTPTTVSPITAYTIAAYNSSGSSSTTINFEVTGDCPEFSGDQNYIVTYTPREEGMSTVEEVIAAGCNITKKLQVSVQYFDGLGRPLQTVQVKGNGEGTKDLVQPVAYDEYGREAVKYLPYTTNAGGPGSYRADALSGSSGYSNSAQKTFYSVSGQGYKNMTDPYAVTVFEPSPLNRIEQQGAPGAAWQPAASRTTTGRTLVTEYGTNNSLTTYTTNGFAVRLYKADAVTASGQGYKRKLSGTGYYGAGQLYLTISKDENWTSGDGKAGTTEEYKDKQEQVILKRTFNKEGSTIQTLSTYYVYDDLGNLSFVLPPGANPDAAALPSQAVLDGMCYQYRYDGRKRLTEKKIPGKGWEFLVYNTLDQVVMAQDSVQRGKAPQEWLVSKYDAFGRVVITGTYTPAGSTANTNYRTSVQTSVDGQAYQWETRTTSGIGYTTNRTFPTTALASTLTVNYYDDYSIPGLPVDAAYNQGTSYSNAKSLPTASKTQVLGTSNYLWNVNYYDSKGQVVKSVRQHYKGASTLASNYDEITNTYSFTGEIETSIRKHFITGTESLYVYNEYKYDHMGRKTDTYQTTGNTHTTGNAPVLLSRNVYNELGQLKEKRLHGTDGGGSFVQTVSYSYNERGWLSSQSAPLFSQELKYQEAVSGVTAQYNGNISRQQWGTGKYYNYSYDKINRLTNAVGSPGNHESIGYDVMGNITRMKRWLGGTVQDQMRYTYTASTSRLASVADTNANVSDTRFQLAGTMAYSYDGNGNMTARTNTVNTGSNIVGLTYNHMNLPKTLTAGGVALTYIYDAAGNKLRKYGTSVNNEYISGIHYNSGALEFVQTETGRVIRNGTGADPAYLYEYTLADHLGNGRVYFDISGGVARKIQETDYYSFGLAIQASAVVGSENRYQYNGKEKQDQEKTYDYGARFYDPVIGRWNVVDPMASTLYEISPYAYVRNNPALRIDRNGLWDITVHAYNDRTKYGYGIAVVTDRHGKEVYRFDVRLEGVGGRDRSKANSDTPLGVYDIPDENMWISGGDRGGYGANHRLVLNGESGEIKESGRGLIRIHGGRQEVYDAKTGIWKPVSNAQLKKTQGCLRCADEDVKALKQVTDELMKMDKKEKGGKLTILDDLMEVTTNNPVPFEGTSTTYVNPGESASTEEKNKWNNIIKEFFGTK